MAATVCLMIDPVSTFATTLSITLLDPVIAIFNPDTGSNEPYTLTWDQAYPWALTLDETHSVVDTDGGTVLGSADLTWRLFAPPICFGVTSSPPEFVLEPSYTAPEGSAFSVPVGIVDADGDAIVSVTANVGTLAYDTDTSQWIWSVTTGDGPGSLLVTLTATDAQGETGTDVLNLVIQNVAPTVTGLTVPEVPVPLGTAIDLAFTFTDPAGALDNPYRCAFNVNTSNMTWVSGEPGSVDYGTPCRLTYTYTEPGVCGLTFMVDDKDGRSGRGSGQIVVYDPGAGFVTGAGSFLSQPGMYGADFDAAGPARFGFVAKYKKGQTVPEGTTGFRFDAGALRFQSTAYDWLVVKGGPKCSSREEGRLTAHWRRTARPTGS
jgi:hypothetical protein